VPFQDPNLSTDNFDQQAAIALARYNSDPAFQQAINANVGDIAWMLKIPELQSIVLGAAANGWGQGIIDNMIAKTQWWQTNGTSVRLFNQTQAQDPASAANTVAAQRAQVLTIAQGLGVNLTPDQLTSIATKSAMFQFNQEQMTQEIRGYYQVTPPGGSPTGQAADMQTAVRQSAGNYLMPSSDNMVNWWTAAAVRGGQTPQQMQEELNNYLGKQAAQRFPWMATAISMGMTPKDYLSPYTQQAATTLAISPDSIDWTDPKWTGALLHNNPDGTVTPVNSDQFNKNLMQNPQYGYSKTQGAIDQAYAAVKTIQNTFGATK